MKCNRFRDHTCWRMAAARCAVQASRQLGASWRPRPLSPRPRSSVSWGQDGPGLRWPAQQHFGPCDWKLSQGKQPTLFLALTNRSRPPTFDFRTSLIRDGVLIARSWARRWYSPTVAASPLRTANAASFAKDVEKTR
jgi:hypothetical protein